MTMENGSHRALILLGSNIEREHNIPAALKKLAAHPDVHLVAVSQQYESAAVGGHGPQPLFSNSAVLVKTQSNPAGLRRILREIEATMGRVRSTDKNAPRPIDLDIVMYDDFVGDVAGSTIPDPDLLSLAHVVIPCSEIAPDWIHPITGETLQQVSAGVDRTSLRRIPEQQ